MNGARPAFEVISHRRTHWQFASWIALEKRIGATSSFHFVPRQGSLWQYARGTPDPFYDVGSRRFRELFRYLRAEGAEVALQASYRAGESRSQLAAEKERLERAAGEPISGNRHHYLRLDARNPEATLLLHEQVDLEYDASLGHERYLGWRRGLCSPFYPFHRALRRELRTLQLSTAWMDSQLFLYKADNPGDRAALLRRLADRVADHGGCLVVNIHDYVYDDRLFPGWSESYAQLIRYLAERGDFWVDTPRAITRHWAQRSAELKGQSSGLGLPSDVADVGPSDAEGSTTA
jgi:hypothetical protein